jgi:nitroimidazol reductase NimA-like FMN-containing flavoprotein (pyridoxamine 5'-phosphate oxidase superfamily)
MLTTVLWPETVEPIVDRDHVVMLAYVTPAGGVVLTPVTNFGVHDREAGTVTVNSSVGAPKKLDRIRRNPHVALAFHTRAHALHDRSEYVLMQGTASLSEPIPDYPASMLEHWERFERWSDVGPLWKRWLRVYALRVGIETAVERVTVWTDLSCRGSAEVHGASPVGAPEPQRPPARGTSPRIDQARAARQAARLPDVLLGWVGADGYPVVVPVTVAGTADRGIVLAPPEGLVPPGGRRAGLTAHWFARRVIGQHQRVHTGWLEADPGESRVTYAPHTAATYRFPSSEMLFRIVAGGGTRWRLRQARRAGIALA